MFIVTEHYNILNTEFLKKILTQNHPLPPLYCIALYLLIKETMKHLLNDLSEEERNNIREQHAGGMKVSNARFNTLLETKSGDVKPLISERESPERRPQRGSGIE